MVDDTATGRARDHDCFDATELSSLAMNLAHSEARSGGGSKAVDVLFIIPRDPQPARGYGAAARTLRALPSSCPHGHTYTADSTTIAWEPCPCWPVTGGGHHLISCRPCHQQQFPQLVNVPECIYLGF